jgi:salicylate hydroxylase
VTSRSQLPQALQLFQTLRESRGESIARETFKQRNDFHMRDGLEQEERDKLMPCMLGKELRGPFPSRWACPDVQSSLYGYDTKKDFRDAILNSS